MRGSINGIALRKTARLEFPKEDAANPEIDRMWAWRRIDGLLKEADRTGSRDAAISEVVRLGEGYSIVTEYTSFIVLENDAEYLRWKIARNNVLRTGRAVEAVRCDVLLVDEVPRENRLQHRQRLVRKDAAAAGPKAA